MNFKESWHPEHTKNTRKVIRTSLEWVPHLAEVGFVQGLILLEGTLSHAEILF